MGYLFLKEVITLLFAVRKGLCERNAEVGPSASVYRQRSRRPPVAKGQRRFFLMRGSDAH